MAWFINIYCLVRGPRRKMASYPSVTNANTMAMAHIDE